MKLIKYEAARQALADVRDFDEAKSIRDKAEAMAAYARMANDTAMVEWATEIKVRAERKCGEMLRQSQAAGSLRKAGNPQLSNDSTIGLADIGITRDQSSRYQKLADMPAEHFETAVETAKAQTGQVTTAFMLRVAAGKRAAHPKTTKTAQAEREALATVQDADQTAKRLLGVLTHVSDAVLDELADAISAVRETRALQAA